MKKIIILRHGNTDYNDLNIFQGRIDININELGRAQILESINNFSDLELIISSPLKRAIQSAQILQEKLKTKIEIYNEFTERSMGIYEGVKKIEAKKMINREYQLNALGNIYFQPLDGESINQVFQRVIIGLQKINSIRQNNILIVTHGTVAMVINWLLSRKDPTDFSSFCLKNGKHITYNLSSYNMINKRYHLILKQ